MKWPRGRWNGWRIVGLVVKVRFDVSRWHLALPSHYGTCLSIGPFHIWIEAAYDEFGA